MEIFQKAKVVRLKSHLEKYLVADNDQEHTRQSRRGGASRNARWHVELVDGNSHVVRLKSCHGRYLTASDAPFLLGMTGHKVLQTAPENMKDLRIEWQPIKDGFQIKLRAYGGTYLRANGGTPPWRNSITHDNPHTASSTHNWILWDVEAVEVPEDEQLSDYLSLVSTFSSLSDELSSLDMGSPVSMRSSFSPRVLKTTPSINLPAMEMFHRAKTVRLRSHHDKYLTAEEDEESVTQDRNGAARSARWTVEFPENTDNVVRLKSCYGKYLTASNQPFLLGMTGRKVLQTLPRRLDSSVEWEPVREGNQVKLRTRYGQFLRANGGLPPWRNSVTHDIPHRTATQEWILWDVHVVDILVQSPLPKAPPPLVIHSDSFASESNSPSTASSKSQSFSGQESGDSLDNVARMVGDGRLIFYRISDDYGELDGVEERCMPFKGNGVGELKKMLEEETGLEGIIVCTRSVLNGKLYPLRLALPPNNADMAVVIVPSSSTVAGDFATAKMPL
ncbi:uncharacterized protein LOC116004584 [Ipomoea triloba]|uniref:uncharacterized protein LOC116004584 n=1 Tax=Ipomoea triloba TaxID=35885 RepID=UPI00125CDDEF|nr:uncharacterized protein LOC116004584 [Ipomoea triloba]